MEYARWETKENMEKSIPLNKINRDTEIKSSGLPMAYDEDYLYVDSKFSHSMVIGASGSGKTQTITLPMLEMSCRAGENVLIQDNMGELYEHTKDMFKENGYNVIRLDFNNADNSSNGWNPFQLAYNFYKNKNTTGALDLIEDIAHYLLVDQNDFSGDSFWINSVVSYFTGLVLYLFENNNEVNLQSIYDLDSKVKDNVSEFMNKLDKEKLAYISLNNILLAPTDTRASIFALFGQKIRRYVLRSNLMDILCKNDLDISSFSEGKNIIYVNASYAEASKHLLTLLITQLVYQIENEGYKKNISVILDEFDNLLPIKDFSSTLNVLRHSGVMFTIVIKSFNEIYDKYSKEEADKLKNSFTNKLYLLSPDLNTLDEISQACGIGAIVDDHEIPLVTVEELKTFKMFEAIAIVPRMMPFRTKLLPYYAMKNKNVV